MSRLVFIDIETTGLISGYHEIIEIAIVGHNLQYHKKVKPKNIAIAEQRALEINGYSDKAWRYAEEPSIVAEEIAEILKGARIVGHNPQFDMDFISELLTTYNQKCFFDRRYIDTITLAYEHLSPLGVDSFSLDACRRFFNWSQIGAHTALKDAKDCQRLFYTLLRANRIKKWMWMLHPKLAGLLMLLKYKY